MQQQEKPQLSRPQLTSHHVGVAVASIEKALPVYADVFGYRLLSGPFQDPIQRVSVCFLGAGESGEIVIELVEPSGDNSPVTGVLSKGIGAYHVCYTVRELDSAIAYLRQHGCLILGNPVPAVAFGGRRIAWVLMPTRQLIELLESE